MASTPFSSSRRSTHIAVVAALAVLVSIGIWWHFHARSSATRSAGLSPEADEPDRADRPGPGQHVSGGGPGPAQRAPGGQSIRTTGFRPSSPLEAPWGASSPGSSTNPPNLVLAERFGEAHARNEQAWREYPRDSRAIPTGGTDPVAEARKVTKRERFARDDRTTGFTFYLSAMNLLPDQELQLFGFLRKEQERLPARRVFAVIQPSDQGTETYQVELNDDGRDGDAQGGDLLYTASFRVRSDKQEQFRGAHTVQAAALAENGTEISNSAGFLFSIPKSRLTGRFRDEIVDKNLVVHAQVEVFDEARFHIEATVYKTPDQIIGWGQTAVVLPRGVHEIPISFYGLMFSRAGVPGPYLIRNASLRTTGRMPNDLSDLIVEAHKTAPYALDLFATEPVNAAPAGGPSLPGPTGSQ